MHCNWVAEYDSRIPAGGGIARDFAEADHNPTAVLAHSSVGHNLKTHNYSEVAEHRSSAGAVGQSSPAEEERTVGRSHLIHHTSLVLVHHSLVRQGAGSWIHPLYRTPDR